jgi:hypothetical protein
MIMIRLNSIIIGFFPTRVADSSDRSVVVKQYHVIELINYVKQKNIRARLSQ